MPTLTFADIYKIAGFAPGADIIQTRKEAIDSISGRITPQNVLELTRLYFGLPLKTEADWFRDLFLKTDSSFSLYDNEREASVLSACILSNALDDKMIFAGLAPIVASVHGNRIPLVYPEFIRSVEQKLAEQSIISRRYDEVDVNAIKQPAKSKLGPQMESFLQGPDFEKATAIFKLLGSESQVMTGMLVTQINKVIVPLVQRLENLDEEINMLWWYIGGYSKVLEKPFSELDHGLAALMAGIDLERLTKNEVGPVSAPAILQRLIVNSHPGPNEKLLLGSTIDAIPTNVLSRLTKFSKIDQVDDLCPIWSALTAAEASGQENGAWHGAFKKKTGLETSLSFFPYELALQVYRESLLLFQLD